MERGICPIAVLCFAVKPNILVYLVKRSFFNISKLRWSTRVPVLPHFGSHDVVGHVTIRLAVCGFL